MIDRQRAEDWLECGHNTHKRENKPSIKLEDIEFVETPTDIVKKAVKEYENGLRNVGPVSSERRSPRAG